MRLRWHGTKPAITPHDSSVATPIPSSPDTESKEALPHHEPKSVSLTEQGDLEKGTAPLPPPPLAPAPIPSDVENDPSAYTAEEEEIWYPEGGLKAYLVVLGGWCGMIGGFSLMNSVGVIQAFLQENQLRDYSASTVGWIFSIYLFFIFGTSLQIGPVFDAHGPFWLLLVGSIIMVVMFMALAECTQYWHFILNLSIFGGIGSSLLFTPSLSAIAHWFNKGRGAATGLAATGGAVGGVIIPLALERLFPMVGWAWSMRILGFIYLFVCSIAVLLTRSRLPPKHGGTIKPDFRIFLDGTGALALVTLGTWFLEWGLFVPLSYVPEFAAANGLNNGYQIAAILNAMSFFGRWAPGWFADRIGRFNTMIITSFCCFIVVFAFWLPSDGSLTSRPSTYGLLITFAVLYGFFSGSNISLTPICVGQLCETQEYGRYYATVYTIVSIGSLVGLPIAGSLVKAAGGGYWGVVVFAGMCYTISTAAFAAARVRKVGWGVRAVW